MMAMQSIRAPLTPLSIRRPVVRREARRIRTRHVQRLERGREKREANLGGREGQVLVRATVEGRASDPGNSDRRYAVVVAKFNSLVTKALLDGVQAAFRDFQISGTSFDVYWVPGSFELPVVSKKLASEGGYAAVVCIGAIIRGGTSHYDAVVNAATSGVLRSSMDTGVPVIFGVLTCDTMEQAMDRAGGKMGNKGYEAAVTALEMTDLMSKLS